VDEVREIPALVEKVRAGLISMPEAIRQQGMDPDTTLAEIAAWNAKLDAAGVILATDPRQDLGAASVMPVQDTDEGEDEADQDDPGDGMDDEDSESPDAAAATATPG